MAGVIRSAAHQALEDLRAVIGILRDGQTEQPPGHPQPTLADLEALVEQSRRAGMRIRLDLRVEPDPPEGLGRTGYHIVREALTNAHRHARGCPVRVSVAGGAGLGLTIEARNPSPIGTPSKIPGSGTGLIGLAERVALADGRLDHGTDGGEFRLVAWLPWQR